jgi:hypothetical protein
MKSLLVTYDLAGTDDTSENYENLIGRIQEYPDSAKVQLSTWIIKTDASIEAVWKDLLRFMHSSDRLLVAGLDGRLAWQHPLCGERWIRENL